MKTKTKKSGFSEGRSTSGGSARFGDKPKKKKPVEQEQETKLHSKKSQNRLNQIKKAQEDLADVVRDLDIDIEGSTYDSDEQGKPTSRFAANFNKLRKSSVENSDFNAEAAHKILLKTMFAMTMDLLPVADVAFKKSGKEQAAYALIALAKQAQEISSELRMLGNVESQTEFIKNNIIAPVFKMLVQHTMAQCMHIKNTIDTELDGKNTKPIKRQIDNLLVGLGQYMDGSREQMSANIGMYLAGDMSFMSTGSSDKSEKKRRKRRDQ